MTAHDRPGQRELPEQLVRALAAEVSLRSRLRHLAVGLAGGCGAAVIAVLWPPSRAPCRPGPGRPSPR
ncbi:hypothetical protein [Streptomyces aquilus]|uniref:hypothetical protein n=1 Tax=Streptomyces aquilus TaxID=2548456 RepID=UPI0036C08344